MTPSTETLRGRAEKRMTASVKDARLLPLEEMQAALHELGVYKAELEIQNEELIAARSLLEASQRRYFRHFDLAPVGLVRLSRDAIILETNILAAELLGLSREALHTSSQRFLSHVAPQCHADFQRHLASALESGKMEMCELMLCDAAGVETFVRVQSVRSRGEQDAWTLYVTLTDLTERRKIEQMLACRQAEMKKEVAARVRLEEEILAISEREQRRLGMDLHDGLGQQLTGIALLGKVLADKLKAVEHPCAAAAAEVANYTAETINVTRVLAKGLYPVELDRDGLLMALEDLANQTRQRFDVRCVLRCANPEPRFEKSAEIHLYRMVQESIANALEHGHARSIFIEVNTAGGFHTLSVTDDRIASQTALDESFGLRLIQYRARLIGAQIDMEQLANGGCMVICRLRA
ncbi:MAG: hypothetical protein JWL90_3835 [Chthoniobacteraceae bacterium]|nr:hypothetical protein [Chthoniobacteraceae bacterium]